MTRPSRASPSASSVRDRTDAGDGHHWYLQSPEKSLRTPAKRRFDEFKDLFLLRFAAQYPTGLRVKKSVKKLKIEYQLASGAGTSDSDD